jgi:hypothetical protein
VIFTFHRLPLGCCEGKESMPAEAVPGNPIAARGHDFVNLQVYYSGYLRRHLPLK